MTHKSLANNLLGSWTDMQVHVRTVIYTVLVWKALNTTYTSLRQRIYFRNVKLKLVYRTQYLNEAHH